MSFQSRMDVLAEAHKIGRGKTDVERIALGVTLIGTAEHAQNWAALRHAQKIVGDQADDFLRRAMNIPNSIDPAITHDQLVGRPPRSRDSSSLSAIWGAVCRTEARISNSWMGDGIGAACVIALPFVFLILATVFEK